MRFALVVALAVFFSVSFGNDYSYAGDAGLLFPGTFNASEVSAKDGEVWLGLYQTGLIGEELREVRIKVEDGTELDAETGKDVKIKTVSVDRPERLVFLVKGHGLKPGNVKVTFPDRMDMRDSEKKLPLYPGYSTSVGFGYDLAALGCAKGIDRIDGYRLLLTNRKTSQEFGSLPDCCHEIIPTLDWAGDLDGDGKPDLLINLTNQHILSDMRLYLSKGAGKGKLVNEAASMRW